MHAVFTEAPGGWDHTQWTEVPDPTGGPDEVLVEIQAAALNPADGHLIEGRYPGGPNPPFIAGRDAAGVVLQGDRAGTWSEGDPVVVLQTSRTDLARGTFCRRQTFPAGNLAPRPENWSVAEGAAGPLVALTAWQALVDRGRLREGEIVLVTGASGGVGLAAVQLARGLGAIVVALSRSEEKRARLMQSGAHHVFPPDDEDLKHHISSAVGRKGVDLVVDNVGGPSLKQAVHLLGPGGRVSVVGVLGGLEGTVPIPSLLFKQASLSGILVTGYSPAEARAAWDKIVETLARTGARPIVDSRFPVPEFREAFRRLQQSPFGKVVLDVPAD